MNMATYVSQNMLQYLVYGIKCAVSWNKSYLKLLIAWKMYNVNFSISPIITPCVLDTALQALIFLQISSPKPFMPVPSCLTSTLWLPPITLVSAEFFLHYIRWDPSTQGVIC
jgi:hypothetical protein